MTIAEIGKANDIENIVLKKAFGLQTKEELKRKFTSELLTHAGRSDKQDKQIYGAAGRRCF